MTPAAVIPSEDAVRLVGVTWEDYKRRNDAIAGRGPRMTYDGGVLEIMTLGALHERLSWLIGRLFEELAIGFEIDFEGLRSATCRREDLRQGFEGDGSYYIRDAARMRRRERIDLTSDPAPELVIEIDISRRSLDKLPLFASMGVEEAWRFQDERLHVLLLDGGEFRDAARSRVLPAVGAAELNELLAASEGITRARWLRLVQDWARTRRGV